jgi:hypothetical protein
VRYEKLTATIGLLLVMGPAALAQQGSSIRRVESPQPDREIERSALVYVGAWRPSSGPANATRVVGTVIDIRQVPVAGATVQLRNLDTSNVESQTQTDIDGYYAFELEATGTYVVEMILVDGYVIALSNAGSVARYETLQTVVQLPGRWDATRRNVVTPVNMAAYFGLSAETSMTATTIGIATTTNITPADPGVPVSP